MTTETAGLTLLSTIHRAGQTASEIWADIAHKAGLHDVTDRQAMVLAAIADADGPSQTAIVEATSIDRSTLADLVRRLTKRGLVNRQRNRNDGRAYVLSLTAEGKAALRKSKAIGSKIETELHLRISGLDRLKIVVVDKQAA